MADEAPPAEPVLLFRPTKKRKAYRARPSAQDDNNEEHKQQQQQQQREQTGPGSRTTTSARNRRNGEAPGDNNDNDDDNNNNDNDSSSSSSDSDDGNYDGVAAALRARSMRRKLHGVNFQSSSHGGGRGADPWSLGNASPDADADGAGASQVVGMSNRFMHQTGLVKDHSAKHLNEFIASRLSTRTVAPNPPDDDPLLPSENTDTITANAAAGTLRTAPAPQGVKQGRLEEVALPALPPRNPPQTQIAAPPKKVRLGPDGKPWRGRKRRASDDVKRDQLVEEFLHENRLDVYDVPKADENSASEADGAADERLAKEFRQQYLDDVARRQQSKKKKKQQQQGKKGQHQQSRDARPAAEVLRGPKLGGSRNSRAQVRNQLLKEKKEAAAKK